MLVLVVSGCRLLLADIALQQPFIVLRCIEIAFHGARPPYVFHLDQIFWSSSFAWRASYARQPVNVFMVTEPLLQIDRSLRFRPAFFFE